ncbi:MAG: class I SAM-dependent rRNA methyltransferase [Deltaproteobacteria bacterium]|nr:class I SAM-dependent rRNA methyltransferase [Deltaproteobacteria bacterium]
MTIWTLQKGHDRRFRGGHPWVYSNELAASPKGIAPGDPVELRGPGGEFLAWGYGHPGSLIAFRALGRNPLETQPWSAAGVLSRLRGASALRRQAGLGQASHRLVFGEADALPGLVVDRYRLTGGQQVLAVQAQTAGADRLLPALREALETLTGEETAMGGPSWEQTALVIRNDTRGRVMEGLEEEPPRLEKALAGVDLTQAELVLEDGSTLTADLVGGQKTGFFLDQRANVTRLAALVRSALAIPAGAPGPLNVLDVFGYVGQWGAALARTAKQGGATARVTVMDSSASALERAQANLTAAGAQAVPLKADAMKALLELPAAAFQVVVADPPAFIRSRKDQPTGQAAYAKLFAQALRLTAPGGLVAACSCSQLLSPEDFREVLAKAESKSGRPVRWVAQGGQGPDHPVVAAFPEGNYLKCWLGVVG